jgi:serine phosphatase RsbU (regulator of sigma subunit)
LKSLVNKAQVAVNLIDNMQTAFALFDIVSENDKVIDLRMLWANPFYLGVIRFTAEEAFGRLFSELAPNDVVWIPFYGDVALRKTSAQIVESYSEEAKSFIHVQAYSPEHGQVATIIQLRSKFVQTEMEKEQDEQKIRAMINTMPEGIFFGRLIYDEANGEPVDIHCLYANQAFEIYEGAVVNTLQGKNFFELYPEGIKGDLYKSHEAISKNKKMNYVREGAGNRIIEVNIYPQGNNQLFVVERDITKRAKAEKALKEAHETILSGIEYASKIQANLLPPDSAMKSAFSDHSVIWAPRDIVGGDIYWMKQFDKGTVLCVCDCTGHGAPGALLTTLVVSALESAIWPSNCHDTAQIVWQIEKRLADVFNVQKKKDNNDIKDGCDLAVLFIANDGNIAMSSGHTDVFVCDGKSVTRYKGQKIFIGEGRIKSKDDIKTVCIPSNPDNKFYIASDGLYDQPGGGQGIPFGYKRFEKTILDNHGEKQSFISDKVWKIFEAYRGNEPRVDDFELITFKPYEVLRENRHF